MRTSRERGARAPPDWVPRCHPVHIRVAAPTPFLVSGAASHPARSRGLRRPRGKDPPSRRRVPARARGGSIVAGGGGSVAAWSQRRHPDGMRAGGARRPPPKQRRGPAEVDFGEPSRGGAEKRAEELRPPRPLPGTEAPGTEARPGARVARPQLGLVSPGPASAWGRDLDVTFCVCF